MDERMNNVELSSFWPRRTKRTRRALQNAYLEGNYAPVRREEDVPALEVVAGEVPSDLEGALYRIGPAPRFEPVDRLRYHWFDGDGMIDAFRFEGGRVSHKNRWVRTDKLVMEERAGRALFGGIRDFETSTTMEGFRALGFRRRDLLEMKARALLALPPGDAEMLRLLRAYDRSNTHVLKMAGRLVSLIESAAGHEIDPETLETRGRFTFDGLFDVRPMSAHPKIDPATGVIYTFGYGFMPPHLSYYAFEPEGKLRFARDIEVPFPAMMHDFSITETKAIFYHMPSVLDFGGMVTGKPIRWEPSRGARIGVVARDEPGARVRWFEIPPCFVYHPMNAHDDGSAVVLDVIRYPRLPLFDLGGENPNPPLSENPQGWLVRWRLDLATGAAKESLVDAVPMEFPSVDPRFAGRTHRYGWAACHRGTLDERGGFNAVGRYDFRTGGARYHVFGASSFTSEPVFAPRGEGAAEGEGWILSVVYRADEDRSDVVILDALDIERPPVAVLRCRRRVPYGFHGSWVAAAR